MIEIWFTCGHKTTLDPKQNVQHAKCEQCGCEKVEHVIAPRPRFRGACSGPLVENPHA
jgi:hypothetical protein